MAKERTGAQPVGPSRLGEFVRTAEFGVGRLAELDGAGGARVRYFRCPGASPYVDRLHARGDFTAVSLRTHTRAYLNDGSRWRIGRIDGTHPQDPAKYLIAFPNGEGAVLPVEAFDVRWNVPVTDPFEILHALGGDSPGVYNSRLTLISEWSRQRAGAVGVEGLLLGSVELHPHQLNIVRRVADDPIQRYLLADEVGLGKTVEAGALIWQFLAEKPSARVLVLAPEHLRLQWANELDDKFHLDRFASKWLRIRAHTNDASWPTEPVDVLVIDEAHHMTRAGSLSPDSRRRVTALAHGADKVLLLSATPVRSNEAAFLDLLHLLDPAHYDPNDLDAFVQRVELRDRLALTHQALVPNLDLFDLSLYADELTGLFPQDQMLADLLSKASALDDNARPESIARVREHLSETYRLHHRLLRTRRTPEIGATFRVRGRTRGGPFTLEIDDESDDLRRDLLDRVRIHLVAACEERRASAIEATEAFRHIAERCGSLPDALLPLLEPRDAGDSESFGALHRVRELVDRGALPDWRALIREIQHGRPVVLARLADVLSQVTLSRGVQRAVLASGFTETAEAAATYLAERWGSDRVAVHLRSRSREENTESVARWESDDPCALLFCDSGAEEGINLQSANALIHLDLPWEAFRLEQRIGRCDRHVRNTFGPIPSMVVMYGDQPYALNWFAFLADGCAVFDRSVSSLQYVLSDTERSVHQRVLAEGPESLYDAVAAQATTLASERVRIGAHDALDSIEVRAQQSTDEDLLASDALNDLSRALISWFEGVGCSLPRAPGVVEMKTTPRPQIPFGLEFALSPWANEPLAVERPVAVRRALPMLRAGHPFLDVIVEHLRGDDRGVAFAFFRPARGHWPPIAVLRTDFLVTTTPNVDLISQAEPIGLSAWIAQVIEETTPPVTESVLMRDNGHEVSNAALCQPYEKSKGDRNLSSRPYLFDRLTQHLDWAAICSGAYPLAEGIVRTRASLTSRPRVSAAHVRREVLRRADRQRARRTAGLLDIDADDLDVLIDTIPDRLEPTLTVLGCGVILLADPKEAGIEP